MSLLGGLLAGVGQDAKGTMDTLYHTENMAEEDARQIRLKEAAAKILEQAEIRKEQRGDERRIKQQEEIMAGARGAAEARGQAALNPAEETYRQAGLLGNAAVQQGLKEAREREGAMTNDDILNTRVKLGYDNPDKAIDNERQKRQDSIQEKRYAADDAHKAAELKLRERELSRNAQLNDIQYKAAKLNYERALDENKIPAAVSKRYATLDAEMKSLNQTMNTLTGKGELTPEGGKELLTKQAEIVKEMNRLTDPYMPKDLKSDKPKGTDELYPPKNPPTKSDPEPRKEPPAASSSNAAGGNKLDSLSGGSLRAHINGLKASLWQAKKQAEQRVPGVDAKITKLNADLQAAMDKLNRED